MLILAIDCSGSACAVCVWQDGKVLAVAHEHMERGQDARLMPMIVDVMAQAGHEFTDLDRIAVTRGPGSFTGVRVGLAAARGIGLAAGKPVIGIDRFAIYHAIHTATDKNLLVVIESKREELFCKLFSIGSEGLPRPSRAGVGGGGLLFGDPELLTKDQIDEFIKTHPNTDIIGDRVDNVETISICAALAAKADLTDPAHAPRPLYLRAPDVTVAKSKSAC